MFKKYCYWNAQTDSYDTEKRIGGGDTEVWDDLASWILKELSLLPKGIADTGLTDGVRQKKLRIATIRDVL